MLEILSKELTSFDKRLFEVALNTKGECGIALKSAVRHIERSLILVDSMPEVSAFLAMTAEEEIVTGLFHLLKQKQFSGSEKLNKNNHLHKQGVYLFTQLLLESVFNHLIGQNVQLRFDDNNVLRLDVPLSSFGKEVRDENGNELFISPIPPLGTLSVDENGNHKSYDKDIHDLAKSKNISNINSYLKKIANQRNKVLYATPNKIPECKNADEIVKDKIRVMTGIVIMFLLIFPHQAKRQILVQDALNAYLQVLGKIERNT